MWCLCALSDYLGEREHRSLADLKAPFPTLKRVAIASLPFSFGFVIILPIFLGTDLTTGLVAFGEGGVCFLVTFVYFIWPCMVPSHWRLDNITAFSF